VTWNAGCAQIVAQVTRLDSASGERHVHKNPERGRYQLRARNRVRPEIVATVSYDTDG
jgi:hypothetical protein